MHILFVNVPVLVGLLFLKFGILTLESATTKPPQLNINVICARHDIVLLIMYEPCNMITQSCGLCMCLMLALKMSCIRVSSRNFYLGWKGVWHFHVGTPIKTFVVFR